MIIYLSPEPSDIMISKMNHTFIILNIVIFFWFIGFTLVSNKSKFKFKEPNFKNSYLINTNVNFGIFCLLSGLIVYVFIYLYSGYGFIEALSNPLQFRFDIIGLTGGYYLRNISLWLLNISVVTLLIFYFNQIKNSNTQKLMFTLLSIFIFVLLLPFGQRLVLLVPLMAIGFILYNDKVISNFHVLIGVILALLLLSITGIYRTIAFFGIVNFQDILYLTEEMRNVDSSGITSELVSRFDNLSWFSMYLSEELYFENSRSFIESIKQLFILLVPPSFLGGIEKQMDYDTYLTIYFLGSQDFGTYGFTPMSEWSMNFGKKGYIMMSLISGAISSCICNNIRLIKTNMFYLIFFSSFIFLDILLISFHSQASANVIFFVCFNIGLYIFYKIFFLLPLERKV